VRLRSIGDAVLATPSVHALRRLLPNARIDLLLEDWVAPLFDGRHELSHVVRVGRGSLRARLAVARELRRVRYDVAFDLHGGTTSTLLAFASGARERVGYARYQLSWLLTRRAPAAATLWGRGQLHSVEEQLGLLGFVGVPVDDRPATVLSPSDAARERLAARLKAAGIPPGTPLGLLHPAAAFESKRWALDGFARVAEHVHERGLAPVAIGAWHESGILSALRQMTKAPLETFVDLGLDEVVALVARSRLLVGNDAGIAHVAAAVGTPVVVIFGSSNVTHWRPWTDGPAQVVRHEVPCAPCAGYTCDQADALACIRGVRAGDVLTAVDGVLDESGTVGTPSAHGPRPILSKG